MIAEAVGGGEVVVDDKAPAREEAETAEPKKNLQDTHNTVVLPVAEAVNEVLTLPQVAAAAAGKAAAEVDEEVDDGGEEE